MTHDFCNLIVRRVLRGLLMVPLLGACIGALHAQPVKISGGVVAGGNVSQFQYSPNSEFVVFLADKDTDGKDELYGVRLSSGVISNLSGGLTASGDVSDFRVSPDGARVVFTADKVVNDVDELFRVQIGGQALTMDIDGDDRVLPTTDLLMFSRYQLGLRGSALVSGALSNNATITSARVRGERNVGDRRCYK